MLLQSESGLLAQATSLDEGTLLKNGFPAALKPMVAPRSHSMRPHL